MSHFLTVVLQYPIYLCKGFSALLQSLSVRPQYIPLGDKNKKQKANLLSSITLAKYKLRSRNRISTEKTLVQITFRHFSPYKFKCFTSCCLLITFFDAHSHKGKCVLLSEVQCYNSKTNLNTLSQVRGSHICSEL